MFLWQRNVIADALSRVNPLPPAQQEYELQAIPVHTVSKTVPSHSNKTSRVQTLFTHDSTLTKLKHVVQTGWSEYPKDCDPELKTIGHIVKKLA